MGRWAAREIVFASIFLIGAFLLARPVRAQYCISSGCLPPGELCCTGSTFDLSCAVTETRCNTCIVNGTCLGPGETCCTGSSYFDLSCAVTETRCGIAPTPTPTPTPTLTPTPTPTPTPHPDDCYCTAGSCYDPVPWDSVAYCYDTVEGLCGVGVCSPEEVPRQSHCLKADGRITDCITRCVYDVVCDTGFCSGGSCITISDTGSINPPGPSYFCEDSGCSSCERQTGITYCECQPGAGVPPFCVCSYICKFDESCGVGCGGPTPGPGPTPTPTPTGVPPPPVCTTPTNNAPTTACVSQTTYNVSWRWNVVPDATQYHIVVSTGTGVSFWSNVVYDSGWQTAAYFSCGGGTCSHPMTGFSSGTTYYSRVQAVGTCSASNWSGEQSAFQNCVVACAAPLGLAGSSSTCPAFGQLTITWQWTAVSGATQYRLQVDASPADWAPPFGYNNLLNAAAVCSGATCTYTTTGLAPGTWNARVMVTADNGTFCTAPSGWSTTAIYTNACLASVQGTVYNDPFGDATINLGTGLCSFPGGPPPTAANSGTVTIDDDLGGAWTGSVGGLGTYSANNVPIATNRYDATFTPSGAWVCMCPAPDPGNPGSCFPYANTIDAPMTGVNFFVSTERDSWFQTVGGDVHAFGSIKSLIPDTCAASPTCTPEFSLPGADDVGVVSSQVGPGNYGAGGGTVSSTGWEATSTYQGPTYLFDFWRRESDPPTPLANLNARPSPPEGIYEITSGSDLTLSGNWSNIPGAGPLTIFVNFDSPTRTLTLNPNPPGITLNPGSPQALFTLITNGNVRVADTVTRIEGVLLIDGQFRSCVTTDCGYDTTSGTSYQLQFLGTLIAWGGFDLQRDLFLENRDTPAELFTYEPKFIPRLPEFILRAIYTWKEVAP